MWLCATQPPKLRIRSTYLYDRIDLCDPHSPGCGTQSKHTGSPENTPGGGVHIPERLLNTNLSAYSLHSATFSILSKFDNDAEWQLHETQEFSRANKRQVSWVLFHQGRVQSTHIATHLVTQTPSKAVSIKSKDSLGRSLSPTACEMNTQCRIVPLSPVPVTRAKGVLSAVLLLRAVKGSKLDAPPFAALRLTHLNSLSDSPRNVGTAFRFTQDCGQRYSQLGTSFSQRSRTRHLLLLVAACVNGALELSAQWA